MRAVEYLQLDTWQIVARSKEIILHNRVLDYAPGLEDRALGEDEAFAQALAGGFARFFTFLGATVLDAITVREALLRRTGMSLSSNLH